MPNPWDGPSDDIAVGQSLDDFILNDEAPEGAGTEGWVLGSDDDASWAMACFAQHDRSIKAIQSQATTARDRISRWERTQVAPLVSQRQYYEGLLTEYVIRVRDETNEERKTFRFPDGEVSTRPAPKKPPLIVENEADFFEWAERTGYDRFIKVEKSVKVGELKQVVDYEGENVRDPLATNPEDALVPGIRAEIGEVTATVKAATE